MFQKLWQFICLFFCNYFKNKNKIPNFFASHYPKFTLNN
jgi:hypothetical protein